eukprot:6929250-Ditylum_brightwellii.AAC.1
MVTKMTAKSNADIATIIKNIRHREEIKKSFKILQPISKGNQGGAVSTILVPEESGWVPIEDDNE